MNLYNRVDDNNIIIRSIRKITNTARRYDEKPSCNGFKNLSAKYIIST